MKNYMSYLDYQLRLYGLMVLSFVTTYGIAYNYRWREPIVITPELIVPFVSGSLSFILVGAYIMAKQNPFNK
jgi:hypothetical protein